ncbi:MAG: hypothetical protein ACTSRC_10795 [Candidatus Helarchaeota archaeon]
MENIKSFIPLDALFITISFIVLHIFHFRGSYTLPFPPFLRYFTRLERFFMRLMFKVLKSDKLFSNRLIRVIPEFISWFAANGARPKVYTLQELEHFINAVYKYRGKTATKQMTQYGILMRPCPCRDAQQKYSKTLPNVTDVLFTNNKKALPQGRDNIFISKNQLIKRLRRFDEKGLVHIVLGCCGLEGFGINICNCHKSVCFILLAKLGRDIRRGLDPGPSIAVCDSNLCKGIDECGKCLTRCVFHARIQKNGKGAVIPELCYGCGLCANTCESGATTMQARSRYKESYFPLSISF